MKKIIRIYIFLLLFSCVSSYKPVLIAPELISAEGIKTALDSEEFLHALWLAETALRDSPDSSDFSELKEIALSSLYDHLKSPESTAFDKSESEEEIEAIILDERDKMNFFLSLKNLDYNLDDIYYEQLISDYSESMKLKNNSASDWYRLFLNKNIQSPKKTYPSWDNIIKATVTVYLDRGIKIEGGFGYKDMMLGSGFFVSDDGYIITNYHVISSNVDPEYEGFSRVFIRLDNQQSPKIPVRVVGWDPLFDLALLKAEIDAPSVIPVIQSGNLRVGQKIFAVGSPGGLEKTLTSGIVSSPKRPLLELGNVIQVDVPINHGNSGGPLLDENGNLTGIVFAGVEEFEGINFAIPSEYLINVLYKMALGGKASYPFLGFTGLKHTEGIEVIYVFPGKPAQRSGLKSRDIITAVNGIEVNSPDQLFSIMTHLMTNTLVSINVLRIEDEYGEKKEEVNNIVVKAVERNDEPLLYALEHDLIQNILFPVFGMDVDLLKQTVMYDLFLIKRILPGSVADEQGFSPGDTFKLYNYVYMEEFNIIYLDLSIKKKTSANLDVSMQIGSYLFSPGIF